MEIRITKIDPRAVTPAYGTDGSAAFDLTTIEETLVPAGKTTRLRTGLIFSFPKNYVFFIFARGSTFGKFGVILGNSVGVIDSDYCGPNDEVLIYVLNPGNTDVTIPAGSRVAQGIVFPHPTITFTEGEAAGTANRGGFGSTG